MPYLLDQALLMYMLVEASSAAGSLSWPSCLCVFRLAMGSAGSSLGGVANAMVWGSQNTLVVGGALSVNGANASLATYNVKAQNWTAGFGATAIPGSRHRSCSGQQWKHRSSGLQELPRMVRPSS